MGDKKEHHKHKQDPNRPQSQDVADLEEISEEEYQRLKGQSQKQRQPTKHDINGRIIRRELHDYEAATTVLIGVGSEQGVEDGMHGKLVAGNLHITFTVYNTQGRTCLAKINVPNQDIIIQNPHVIINPSKH